jgi:hypothetical protein
VEIAMMDFRRRAEVMHPLEGCQRKGQQDHGRRTHKPPMKKRKDKMIFCFVLIQRRATMGIGMRTMMISVAMLIASGVSAILRIAVLHWLTRIRQPHGCLVQAVSLKVFVPP